MKSCRAIWQFITKNELYGFIILYKTINVIICLNFHLKCSLFVSCCFLKKLLLQQNLIIALAFSMWLGIKNVIRANRMISLITSSTTDPCLFMVIVFFCWKSVLYWWKKLEYLEKSTNNFHLKCSLFVSCCFLKKLLLLWLHNSWICIYLYNQWQSLLDGFPDDVSCIRYNLKWFKFISDLRHIGGFL
jgi:hypothetical protein